MYSLKKIEIVRDIMRDVDKLKANKNMLDWSKTC